MKEEKSFPNTIYAALNIKYLLLKIFFPSLLSREGLLISRSSVRFRLELENSNSHRFELHRPSIKSTKLLLKGIVAIIIIIFVFHFWEPEVSPSNIAGMSLDLHVQVQ